MPQYLIVTVHTPHMTYNSTPLEIDPGYEEEMVTKAKDSLVGLITAGGSLTLQTTAGWAIIAPNVLAQSVVQVEAVDALMLDAYPKEADHA